MFVSDQHEVRVCVCVCLCVCVIIIRLNLCWSVPPSVSYYYHRGDASSPLSDQPPTKHRANQSTDGRGGAEKINFYWTAWTGSISIGQQWEDWFHLDTSQRNQLYWSEKCHWAEQQQKETTSNHQSFTCDPGLIHPEYVYLYLYICFLFDSILPFFRFRCYSKMNKIIRKGIYKSDSTPHLLVWSQ